MGIRASKAVLGLFNPTRGRGLSYRWLILPSSAGKPKLADSPTPEPVSPGFRSVISSYLANYLANYLTEVFEDQRIVALRLN